MAATEVVGLTVGYNKVKLMWKEFKVENLYYINKIQSNYELRLKNS